MADPLGNNLSGPQHQESSGIIRGVPQIIDGQRAGSHLYHLNDGYFYHRNRERHGVVYLRCVNHGTWACCNATACIIRGVMEHNQAAHTHDPDPSFIQCQEFHRNLIQRARDQPGMRLDTLYHQQASQVPVEVSSRITLHSVRSSLRRAQEENRPNIPRNLHELAVIAEDDMYSFMFNTIDEEESLFAGHVGSSIVISSPRMLAELETANTIFGDATFFVLPPALGAAQLYTIVILRDNHIIPVLHAIMQDRTYESYCELFRYLITLMPNFNPNLIITDFERAQQAAYRTVFPRSRLAGCIFHYDQGILRNTRRLGLQPLVRENADAQLLVRMLMALPLCPPHRVREGFDEVVACSRNLNLHEHMEALFDYVDRVWITGVGPHILSVYGSRHRTTNSNESHHRTLNARVGLRRPSVWRFLDVMREVEDIAWRDLARLSRGNVPSRERRASVLSNDAQIRSLSRQLVNNEISMVYFLRRVSYTSQNVFNTFVEVRTGRSISPERGPPPPPVQPTQVVTGIHHTQAPCITGRAFASDMSSTDQSGTSQSVVQRALSVLRRPAVSPHQDSKLQCQCVKAFKEAWL